MIDACIEHLGGLPSQLKLSDDQVRELLAYHRIKMKSQSVCRECGEQSQTREKECFMCGRTYTEKHGVMGGQGGKNAMPEDMVKALKAVSERQKIKDGTVDVVNEANFADKQAELLAAFKAKCKERGIKLIE